MLTVFFFPGSGDDNAGNSILKSPGLIGDSILFCPGDRIHMKDIAKTRKMENGVAVYYREETN